MQTPTLKGLPTFSAEGHLPVPGLIILHYLGGVIMMDLHYLDLTPLQSWRVETPQSALLGELKGSVRQTHSPPPGSAPHIFGSVTLPTTWPTTEQLALGLSASRLEALEDSSCLPLTGGSRYTKGPSANPRTFSR